MIAGIPLAIWFGILTFVSLFITIGLGIAMSKGKPVFKYQKVLKFTFGTFGCSKCNDKR